MSLSEMVRKNINIHSYQNSFCGKTDDTRIIQQQQQQYPVHCNEGNGNEETLLSLLPRFDVNKQS
jgi:hypothetical protein